MEDIEPTEHYVAQRYLHKPYLIEGLKFDLRVYVLLYGVDPLRIFIYQEGLCRLATDVYAPPVQSNLNNLFMHLTNYAINKNSNKFVFNHNDKADGVGHKRSLKWTMEFLKSQGENTERLWEEIKDVVIKTICTVQPSLAHVYRTCRPEDVENTYCFEVLGFDIFLDRKLKPWLLEVNHSPSFGTDSPLDQKIKLSLLKDTFTLLNLSEKRKARSKETLQKELEKRMFTGKSHKLSAEEKNMLKQESQGVRDKFELKHLGGYQLIFPPQKLIPRPA